MLLIKSSKIALMLSVSVSVDACVKCRMHAACLWCAYSAHNHGARAQEATSYYHIHTYRPVDSRTTFSLRLMRASLTLPLLKNVQNLALPRYNVCVSKLCRLFSSLLPPTLLALRS